MLQLLLSSTLYRVWLQPHLLLLQVLHTEHPVLFLNHLALILLHLHTLGGMALSPGGMALVLELADFIPMVAGEAGVGGLEAE